MKEQMTYIAIDADDVGQSIGGAVVSDDADKLSSISGKINDGVQIFSKWAEYNGGSVISSGSDEAILQVPSSSIEELEDLKDKYQKLTGFSISVGIGEKISDAAKALIYAKVNGKNQIVDYSPEIEEVMKQSITGNLDQEKPEQKLKGGIGDETEPSDVDPKQLKQGLSTEKEHTDDEGEAEEIALDHLTEDPEYYSKLKEMESSKPQTRRPKFEEEDDEALVDQDSEEPEDMEDEELALLEDDDSDEDSKDEKLFTEQEDLDIDGRPDKQEEHGKINPEEDDIDKDGDVEHEEAMAAEAGEKDKYSDEGDFSDEYLEEEPEEQQAEQAEQDGEEEEKDEEKDQDEEEMSEDGEKEPEDEMSDEDMEDEENLDDSIASEMSGEEDQDMLDEGDMTDEELKQAIFDSLQIFKENRDILSSLATQNPDLYNALVVSLQSMIEMAKELGYGGYGDGLKQETAPQKGKDQDQDSSDEDGDMNPDDYEVTDDESASDDILKNENFYSLISKINNTKKLFEMKKKENKKQMLLKLKEKLKKIKDKSHSSGKKPFEDKKKKPPKPKKVEAASFCSSSNQKMKTAGHDCRANEDKDSPMCVARKKMNCRGKNAEKGAAVQKSEKLKNFLENKRKKN